jgi:ketosteroid isomerase-like protein
MQHEFDTHTEGAQMTARESVARYYEAWQTRGGDFSDVPLADEFRFTGPVASFDSADGYRAMAREAGQAVTSFNIRRQFVDGNSVCSIVDWEMSIPGTGRMTAAELLEVEDGVIVRGELIYDAEELRRAMARGDSTAGVGADG